MARDVLGSGRFVELVREQGWEYLHRPGVSGIVIVVAETPAGELLLVEQYEMDFSPEHQVDGKEVARLLKEKKVPTISEMFAEAKQVGHFRVVACSAGLEYMGVDPDAVAKNVDEVMGLPAILNLTAGAETTLFI